VACKGVVSGTPAAHLQAAHLQPGHSAVRYAACAGEGRAAHLKTDPYCQPSRSVRGDTVSSQPWRSSSLGGAGTATGCPSASLQPGRSSRPGCCLPHARELDRAASLRQRLAAAEPAFVPQAGSPDPQLPVRTKQPDAYRALLVHQGAPGRKATGSVCVPTQRQAGPSRARASVRPQALTSRAGQTSAGSGTAPPRPPPWRQASPVVTDFWLQVGAAPPVPAA